MQERNPYAMSDTNAHLSFVNVDSLDVAPLAGRLVRALKADPAALAAMSVGHS